MPVRVDNVLLIAERDSIRSASLEDLRKVSMTVEVDEIIKLRCTIMLPPMNSEKAQVSIQLITCHVGYN